jgi:glycolate oxidase FAD binding subunit
MARGGRGGPMIAPADEAELAEAIRSARSPLAVRGGGTRSTPAAGEVLSVGRLSGIVLHEPAALTLVVRAGTPLSEVEAVLARAGQRLAFEPWDARPLTGATGEPTIGGVAAANVSGPRRVQAGAARDAMIGVRFVDGTGLIVANGGRVMKNVTGYDLVRLVAGSRGALGVITEIAFRLQAIPETEATLVLSGLDDGAAVALLARALGSPYDVSGAAHAQGRTCLRVEGLAWSVGYRVQALRRHLGGGEVREAGESAALWRALRDGMVPGARDPESEVWRVSVRPSDGPRVAASLPGAQAAYDWGGGLVWLRLPPGRDREVGAVVGRLGGHAERPGGPVLRSDGPGVAALTAGLRARFDPRGLFNPGPEG